MVLGSLTRGRWRWPAAGAAALLLGASALAGGCTGEEATPIDPSNPPTTAPDLTEVTHRLEPTEQMREAAGQQCIDDPTLSVGYIRAVDPDTDAVLSELTVDCAEVRAGVEASD